MDISKRLKLAREEKGLSLSKLSELTRIAKSTLQRYETGYTKKIPMEAIANIENVLNLPTGFLMGWSNDKNIVPYTPNIAEKHVTFPVIGEVAAGYDRIAIEDWEGDVIDIPISYLHGRSKEDYFVLKVKGDSMYPAFMEGDRVMVLKQDTLDYSGQVGVVLYDDDSATLKKIEFKQGEDWLRLVPINPTHPTVKVTNEKLEHCRVIGVPKLLIRNIGD